MFTFILNFSCDELDDPDVRITDKDFKAAIVNYAQGSKGKYAHIEQTNKKSQHRNRKRKTNKKTSIKN